MAITKEIILKVDNTEAVESIEQVDEVTTDLTSSLDKMTGGMISGFKNAVSGIRKGVLAMRSLKVAIAATGIGLLVIAIGSLVTFFTSTERGGRRLEVVFAQIGAAVDVIIDRVSALGEWFSNIFSQPFSDSISDLTDTFAGMGDELEREIRLAGELKRATQALTDAEIDLITVNAQRRQDIAKDKLIAKDRTLALDERISALKRALAVEDEILISERVIQAERFRIAASEVGLGESLTEDRRRVQEEQAKLIDLTTASLTRQKEVQSELQALLQEALSDEDGNIRNPATGLSTPELENILLEQSDMTIANAENELLERIKIEKNSADAITKIKRDAAWQEKQMRIEAASFALFTASNLAGQLEQFAEEGSNLQKGLAIIQIQANAAGAILGTWLGFSPYAWIGTASAIIQTAGIVGTMVAQMAKVNSLGKPSKTSVPSGGGGSSNLVPAQSQPPSFNVVGTSDTNQLADTINQQQPVKAFVVASDVTTQQSMDRNIVDSASFG